MVLTMDTGDLTLRDVLEIENDTRLLSFGDEKLGALYWPLVRTQYLRSIISDLFYAAPLYDDLVRRISPFSALGGVGRAVSHNLFRFPSCSILLTAPQSAESLRNGQWHNRLCDDFVDVFPDASAVLEIPSGFAWHVPKKTRRFASYLPSQVVSGVVERVFVTQRHERIADALLQIPDERAAHQFNWRASSSRSRQLRKLLARRIAGLTFKVESIKALLRRSGCRIALIEMGCYGGMSPFVIAAKSMNIVTAEYQHGAISSGHDAYNVGDALRRSPEFAAMLPHYLLGYGSWWLDSINLPVSKVVIGNPHRTQRVGNVQDIPRSRILVLGDGVDAAKYLGLCQALVPYGRNAGLEVVYRPHPSERDEVKMWPAERTLGVKIDPDADLYHSFSQTEILVSEVSTGLFEAVGQVPRILMWDTPKSRLVFPQHPFESFRTSDELVDAIRLNSSGVVNVADVEAVWAPGWRDNYARFIDRAMRGGDDS